MTRIFGDYVYGNGPRADCWWTNTCDVPAGQPLQSDLRCDVAIIGGGFTGLNAAITLAQAGVDVALFEANTLGWGASGRNGGFCCLGGARVDDNSVIAARYGKDAPRAWHALEKAAIAHVTALIDQHDIDVDRHSDGETWLAHRAKDMRDADKKLRMIEEDYGAVGQVITQAELPEHGLNAGFHGAVQVPLGFALNPRKYLAGLVKTALACGASLYENAAIDTITQAGGKTSLQSGALRIAADKVIIATNGYSSDSLPNWLAGRYMPTQSSIVVSRPLSADERAAQGWTSHQMCYDSRNLLHYFRLMPDNRMLFGMRGSLGSGRAGEEWARRRTAEDFRSMFPQWAHVELTHAWSGLVCLSANGFPFIGQIPSAPGLFAALCYHGNGVAMGSFAGKLIAEAVLGNQTQIPSFVQQPSHRFPLGRFRRALLPIAYAGLKLGDL